MAFKGSEIVPRISLNNNPMFNTTQQINSARHTNQSNGSNNQPSVQIVESVSSKRMSSAEEKKTLQFQRNKEMHPANHATPTTNNPISNHMAQSSFGDNNSNFNSIVTQNNNQSYLSFNPNTATYNKSLQFYESQYREKLKDLEQEKKTNRLI